MDVEIHKLPEKEIHLVKGNLIVGVCWTCEEKIKKIKHEGTTYKATILERKGDPYIDFVNLRGDGDGGIYEDEDSVVEGGLCLKYALDLVDELTNACEYLKQLNEKITEGE